MIYFAHRGASGYAPENTLVSIILAKMLGVHWIEFDVQVSKDNVAFILHDDDLKRVGRKFSSDGTWLICDELLENESEILWDLIKDINVGRWFVEEHPGLVTDLILKDSNLEFLESDNLNLQFMEAKIPTLEMLLALSKKLDLSLNIELKVPERLSLSNDQNRIQNYRHRLLDAVLKELEKIQWPKEKILFSSFDLDLINMAYEAKPNYPRAALYNAWPNDQFEKALKMDCSALNIHRKMLTETPSSESLKLISKLQHAKPGFGFNIYTVNSSSELRQLEAIADSFQCKITGIFTDRLKEFIEERTCELR